MQETRKVENSGPSPTKSQEEVEHLSLGETSHLVESLLGKGTTGGGPRGGQPPLPFPEVVNRVLDELPAEPPPPPPEPPTGGDFELKRKASLNKKEWQHAKVTRRESGAGHVLRFGRRCVVRLLLVLCRN